jgi:hypothetical protein
MTRQPLRLTRAQRASDDAPKSQKPTTHLGITIRRDVPAAGAAGTSERVSPRC